MSTTLQVHNNTEKWRLNRDLSLSRLSPVSDTRTPETDKNAVFLREQLEAEGNGVAAYQIIKDEPDQVAAVLDKMAQSDAQVILFNGGTGIAPRDTTFDILDRKLEKTLPGFGELFRMFSYDQVGAAAMLSRATAGVYRGKWLSLRPVQRRQCNSHGKS